MNDFNLIPELNYWFRIVLRNSSVYNNYYDIPAEISDHWRCPASVIELLFNENYHPCPPVWLNPDYGSVVMHTNNKRYIYTYRRCNLLHITDKSLLNRIQIYRWNANVFAANCDKFVNEFNMRGSLYDHVQCSDTTLPYDVDEKDRSPYITYKGRVWFSSNYPLPYMADMEIKPKEEDPIIMLDENILHLTEEDFILLDLLYDYKTGKKINLCKIDFDGIFSPLSKLIYIYLEAMIFHTNTHYNIKNTIGTTMLSKMYEKHVINTLYMLFQKHYGVDFEESFIVNGQECRLEEDMLMLMKFIDKTVFVDQLIKDQNEIVLKDIELPHHRKDFTVYIDGVCLNQDQDYKAEIDKSDLSNPCIKVKFLKPNLLRIGEPVKMFWSYVDPYSDMSYDDETKISR